MDDDRTTRCGCPLYPAVGSDGDGDADDGVRYCRLAPDDRRCRNRCYRDAVVAVVDNHQCRVVVPALTVRTTWT